LPINQDNIWRGQDKTNGFLMRSVDGRIPALKESFSRLDIPSTHILAPYAVVPYGIGLWFDTAAADNSPGAVVCGDNGSTTVLRGIMEFNQGWQTGHPVQNWGVPNWARSDIILAGYVGYKHAMAVGANPLDYLSYIQGERSVDIPSVRTTWTEWVAAWVAAAGSTRMTLWFDTATGFPIMQVLTMAQIATLFPGAPSVGAVGPANSVFAGTIEIWEPENKAMFVKYML
jgi:hypothetical protein